LNTPFRPSGGGFRGPRPNRFAPPPEAHRINHRITAREVRVVSDSGEQLGVMQLRDALTAAEQAGLDLVEVAPTAQPPVCRIMDYGKFKYKEQKKEAEARKKRSETTVKELRIRYRTDVGDLETKLRQSREFLEEGHKVKFSMKFRGREVMYTGLGVEKFKQIIAQLADIADVDEKSPERGSQLYIVFAPKKK
jgi:translation initiation factor IF-3